MGQERRVIADRSLEPTHVSNHHSSQPDGKANKLEGWARSPLRTLAAAYYYA